jgi:hypothetical protein
VQRIIHEFLEIVVLALVLLTLGGVCWGLSKLRWMPKANWMEIGFGLAAAAAVIELVFPSR